MSITDELRGLAHGFHVFNEERLLAIADRIDAEHEKSMSRAGQLLADAEKDRDYNYANWQDCKQKVLQHNITMDELSTEIERLKDELAHRIELPKDADGEHIHVGDVMEWCDSGDTLEVIGIGDDTLFYIDPEGDRTYAEWTSARNKRHHAPTVEDVLREFANEVYADADNEIRDRDFLCAKYAKRLRLAKEDA